MSMASRMASSMAHALRYMTDGGTAVAVHGAPRLQSPRTITADLLCPNPRPWSDLTPR